MKLKKEFTKDVCIDKLLVKIDKLPLKQDKNVKSIESKKTMDTIIAESNMRLTTLLAKSNMRSTILFAKSTITMSILNDMGVIIPDPISMKSNVMAR